MNPKLQRIFDSTQEEEPRSKLEPYRELILRWRRQGKSYRRITKLLAETCGTRITKTPLHEFVQRRSRPRKLQPEVQPEPLAVTPAHTETPPSSHKRLSAEERAAQVAYIRSLTKKPESQKTPNPRFTYDPSKPPINKNYY